MTGSLAANAMSPSISPEANEVTSKPTVTTVILDTSRLLALTNEFQMGALVSLIPIFMPYMSVGVLIGLAAADAMQVGFFWNVAPMICRSAPLMMALTASAVCVTPTRALPETTT